MTEDNYGPEDTVTFYTREGIELHTMTFTHHTDAAEWFSTLDLPGESDLPPGWYAAVLMDFMGPVGTIYNGFAS